MTKREKLILFVQTNALAEIAASANANDFNDKIPPGYAVTALRQALHADLSQFGDFDDDILTEALEIWDYTIHSDQTGIPASLASKYRRSPSAETASKNKIE